MSRLFGLFLRFCARPRAQRRAAERGPVRRSGPGAARGEGATAEQKGREVAVQHRAERKGREAGPAFLSESVKRT